MLEKFGIGVFSEYLTEEEKVTAIRGFAEFYNDQTPKHQKRIKLEWLTKDSVTLEEDKVLFRKYGINSDKIVNVHLDNKSLFFKQVKMILHTTIYKAKDVISDSFSASIPVITVDSDYSREYVDMSCGIILKGRSKEQCICEIAEILDMLYHDSGVVRILSKGASEQYEEKFAWGLRRFRKLPLR